MLFDSTNEFTVKMQEMMIISFVMAVVVLCRKLEARKLI
jgi:hypothetical protein